MAGTTPLTIGADVSCTDGVCGKVSRLVIHQRARTVTHLVVGDRQFQGRLVPLNLVDVDVDATTGQIRLRCAIAEFEKLGHAGRRRRALAAWTSAAGYGLVAWGLGTEAPTPADARENMQRLQREGVLREPGTKAPAAAGTQAPAARRLERHLSRIAPVFRYTDTPVQACVHCRGDGPRRVVGPALAAAAVGARDRRRSPERRDPCPLGGPGRATAQAEDRRRVGPGRSRIGIPAAGSIG